MMIEMGIFSQETKEKKKLIKDWASVAQSCEREREGTLPLDLSPSRTVDLCLPVPFFKEASQAKLAVVLLSRLISSIP